MNRKKLPLIKASDFPRGINRIEESIYSRWNPGVKASNDNSNTITIYEQIGEDWMGGGFTAKKMAEALKAIGENNDVMVSINSPGGDFFEGATIYNLLREHKGKVTVKIPGLAASAASVIAMAGDTIQISEVGFLMIHNAWGLVVGNRHEMTKAADTFNVFDSAMADLYAARTGADRADVVEMMDNDTWMNASDAIENGFADELMQAKSVEDGSEDKKSQAMARRKLEAALAKDGVPRKEREEIFQRAFGKRDAAVASVRDAGQEEDWKAVIQTLTT